MQDTRQAGQLQQMIFPVCFYVTKVIDSVASPGFFIGGMVKIGCLYFLHSQENGN